MPGFERINPIGEGLIRGPARLLVAPVTIAFPTNLSDVINLAASSEGTYAPAVQSLTTTGTPAGGMFTLSFEAMATAPLAYNASSTAVQNALNAIAGIADEGGVTCTGGPLPAAITITFGIAGSQPLIVPTVSGNALTGGTSPTAVVTSTTLGNGQYDVTPGSGWVELGSTRSGVQVAKNNTEDQLDVDQVYGAILGVPDEHTMTVATQFAEATLENISLAWEEGGITADLTQAVPERTLGLGASTSYTNRRLAVLHKKTIGPAAGLIRGVFFRSTTRSAQNSMLDYQKSGQMQTLPHQFQAYIDPNISDEYQRFGSVIEQELL